MACLYTTYIRPLAVLCLLALISACSGLAGPEYARPALPEKLSWSTLENREVSTSEIIQPEWWAGFGDTSLNNLIDRAIADGLDLKILALRMEGAGLAVRNSKGDLLPNVTIDPTHSSGRQYQNGQREAINETETLGLSGTWEIDIWGKLRKQLDVSEARFKASEMDYRAGYLTLVAAVANKYFLIRELDQQIANQETTMQQSEHLLTIYKDQYAEGMVAKTNVLSQQAEINRLKTELYDRQRVRRQTELELATLLGQPAGELTVSADHMLRDIRRIPTPVVLPMDMLVRRPDVLKAEYELLAAHHLVGVARLERLPTLNLNFGATMGSALFTQFAESWKFAFEVSGRGMFDRDVRRRIRGSEVDRKIAAENYKKAVLNAVQEVEIRLNNLYAKELQVAELEQQVEYLKVVRDVRVDRLREGLVSQLELFDTERELLTAQQGVLNAHGEILRETVELYKALGGGWQAEQPGELVSR